MSEFSQRCRREVEAIKLDLPAIIRKLSGDRKINIHLVLLIAITAVEKYSQSKKLSSDYKLALAMELIPIIIDFVAMSDWIKPTSIETMRTKALNITGLAEE